MGMKQIARSLVAGVSACALAGCTSTYSFAPPSVELTKSVSADQRNCGKAGGKGQDLSSTAVDKAIQLAENFTVAYRCATRELANGRMDFEIPSFLALAGGTTAAALGAGSSVAIATGTTSALFGAGQGYFDPKAKFAAVRAGQNASTCVLSVASGGEGFMIKQKVAQVGLINMQLDDSIRTAPDDDQRAKFSREKEFTSLIAGMAFNEEARFYNSVYASLLSIDIIVSEKIANAGKLELEDLKKRLEEVQKPPAGPSPNPMMPGQFGILGTTPMGEFLAAAAYPVDFPAFEKKLQECVIRAHG